MARDSKAEQRRSSEATGTSQQPRAQHSLGPSQRYQREQEAMRRREERLRARAQEALDEQARQDLIGSWEQEHSRRIQRETEEIGKICEKALRFSSLHSVNDIYEQNNLCSGERVSIQLESRYGQGEEEQVFNLETQGSFKREGEKLTLSYELPEGGDVVPGLTRIHYDETSQEAHMEREGQHRAELYFRPQHLDVSVYNTPYGTMSIRVFTKELRHERLEDGGRLSIDYNVLVPNEAPNHTKLHLEYHFIKR